MASRRVPLASNPQAINSPLRPNVGGAKRTRDQLGDLKSYNEDQPPPKKKQVLESAQHGLQRTKAIPSTTGDARIFDTKAPNGAVSSFQKRLVASRDTRDNRTRPIDREVTEKAKAADKDQVKTWQRHYRKVFPTFVFYFESLPDDARHKSLRAIAHLGARDEKFFSKHVTHIITTRPIPATTSDTTEPSSQMRSSSSKHGQAQSQANQARTINPSLLDKHAAEVQSKASQQRSRVVLDMLSQNRAPGTLATQDTRRQPTANTDILVKAREMGIKIWSLEKFERMLNTLLDLEADEQDVHTLKRKAGGLTNAKQQHDETDLQQMLKNEKTKQGGQLPWSDVVAFRGYYIYVHDVEEKNRPVMIREYAKPKENEEGDWPQLYSVQMPKCPFVYDPSSKRAETEKEEQQAAAVMRVPDASRSRTASVAADTIKSRAPSVESSRQPTFNQPSRQMAMQSQPVPPQARLFEPPALRHTTSNTTTDSLPAQLTNRFHFQGIPRPGTGREPLASGLQKSNVTSAIRSQMVSSTAANPVARIGGKSKEMHELQRRAVEQRRSGLSVNNVPSSYMNDVRAAINGDPTSMANRGSRRHAGNALTKIYEDDTQSGEEQESSSQQREQQQQREQEQQRKQWQMRGLQRTTSMRKEKEKKKKKEVQREPKPGYCENCRDKYDDFNEHIISRKHRKFATAAENWTELDGLLSKLKRK